MTTINQKIESALAQLNIPIAFKQYEGTEKNHIVFDVKQENGIYFIELTNWYIGNQFNYKAICKLMRENEFEFINSVAAYGKSLGRKYLYVYKGEI